MIFARRCRDSGDEWRGRMEVGLMATHLMIEAFNTEFAGMGDGAIVTISFVAVHLLYYQRGCNGYREPV